MTNSDDEVLGVLTGQVPVRSAPIAMRAPAPDETEPDDDDTESA